MAEKRGIKAHVNQPASLDYLVAILIGLYFGTTGPSVPAVAPFKCRLIGVALMHLNIHIRHAIFVLLFVVTMWCARRYLNANAGIYFLAFPFLFIFSYAYDPVTLALSSALWVCIKAGRDKGWWGLYAISCVNKETAILFLPRKFPAVGVALYVAVSAAKRIALGCGGVPALHLDDHIRILTTVPLYPIAVAVAMLLILPGIRHWDSTTRRAGAVLACLVVLHVFFGWPLEWRVFYEVLVPVFAMVRLTFQRR